MIAPDNRRRAPRHASESDNLWGWLDFYRDTARWKVSGISDPDGREAPLPPSTLTCVGIIKQVAEVERWWFRTTVLNEDLPMLYAPRDDPERSIEALPTDSLHHALNTHAEEMAYIDKHVRPLPVTTKITHPQGTATELRWVIEHVSHMYARYCGHLDLIRERLDGTVGF